MPRKAMVLLSDKENKLLDFIKNSEVDVTIKVIEDQLGVSYVGALGKILNLGLIESKKKQLEIEYGHEWIKCYFVKEEE